MLKLNEFLVLLGRHERVLEVRRDLGQIGGLICDLLLLFLRLATLKVLEFRAENRVVPLRVLWIGQVSFCLDELGGLLLEKLEGDLSLVLFVLDLVYLSELLLAEVAQVEDELLLGGVGGVEERGLLVFLLVLDIGEHS